MCVPLSVTSATLQPVDFDRWMCVCVPLSVTSATASRLWQTDVCASLCQLHRLHYSRSILTDGCVFVSLCQLHRLQPVDFGRRMCVCPFVSYIGYSRSTLADGYVYVLFGLCIACISSPSPSFRLLFPVYFN